LIWLATDESADAGEAAIRAAAQAARGHARLIRGSESLRARLKVFEPETAPIAALSARIKAAVDPDRLFNPGLMQSDI
jgi:glycolate oxidase FAD binding subunit